MKNSLKLKEKCHHLNIKIIFFSFAIAFDYFDYFSFISCQNFPNYFFVSYLWDIHAYTTFSTFPFKINFTAIIRPFSSFTSTTLLFISSSTILLKYHSLYLSHTPEYIILQYSSISFTFSPCHLISYAQAF